MAWIRSILHMTWIVLTVIPWGLALVVISLWVKRTPLWWFAVAWFRLVVWGTRVILGVQIRVTGFENLPQNETTPVVLLSKHQSALETMLIPTLMPQPLAFVFKRELLRLPFFGWSMARLDMIHIDRRSRTQALLQVITQGRRLMALGVWIILFPEGTRIERGQAGTYQTAGTRLAVETGALVVPIAVSSGKCWPRKGFVKHAGIVDVSIGQPIASIGREPKELMREVQSWIETEMQRIDPEAYR